MTDLKISLPEDKMARLTEKASAYGISPEELVRASVDQLVEGPEAEFKKAADYVLKKNEQLYQRLA
ncbi:MAG: ribbon-helix-helix protein, CopG family [Desulfomonilaceae bacterium]